MRQKILWVVPESQGGIRSYSEGLLSALRERVLVDLDAEIQILFGEGLSVDQILREEPALIHIQHEYGLFGSKQPLKYFFPKWLNQLRTQARETKIIATAHTVLAPDFRYSLDGPVPQKFARWLANGCVVPFMRRTWGPKTWGGLDAVIVHSELQKSMVLESGCPRVEVIPHYVLKPPLLNLQRVTREESQLLKRLPRDRKVVAIFGYQSFEKGQDLAIEAWGEWKKTDPATLPVLWIAGGTRRREDQAYALAIEERIHDLGLANDVVRTGFVPMDQIDEVYRRADLVLAPFRETSGSGSLTQAFARGAVLLTSDLPLNVELNRRSHSPGSSTGDVIAMFKARDPQSLMASARELLVNEARRESLSAHALAYAQKYSPEEIAKEHSRLYQLFIQSRETMSRAPRL